MTNMDTFIGSLVVLGIGVLIVALAAWRKRKHQLERGNLLVGGCRR